MFGAAHKYRRKILLASTSEIYGKNTSVPLAETADRVLGSPAVARWAYSETKAVDEMLAYAYHKERGLPTIVVRLFNMDPADYKKFLNFLRKHDCQLPFQEFRQA